MDDETCLGSVRKKANFFLRAMTSEQLVGRHYRQRSEETWYTDEDNLNKMLLKFRVAIIRDPAEKISA